MSFILDALNKSERERRRAGTPSLESPVAAAPPRRWGFLLGLGVGVLVVAAVAGTGWFFVSGMHDEVMRELLAGPGSSAENDRTDTGETPPAPGGEGTGPRARVVDTNKGGESPGEVPNRGSEGPQEIPSKGSEGTGETLRAQGALRAPPPAAAPATAPAGLSLNVLSYSADPARRFVMINLQSYREGERLPDGSRILEIRADSVLLESGGRELELRP